jgi:helicase
MDMIPIHIEEVAEKDSSLFHHYQYPFDKFNVVQSAVLDHYQENKNFIIASATNSGKTIMAEFFLFDVLVSKNKKAIYLCPLKSLASEKYTAWSDDSHPFHEKKIRLMSGDEEKTTTGNLIIATIESFCHKIRTAPDCFDDVEVIVVDEAHILGTDDRGATLEMALSEFSRKNNAKIVFLSGTLPNADQVAEWLTVLNKKHTIVLNSKYRAVPLNIHYRKYDTSMNQSGNPIDMFDSITNLCEKHISDKILVFVHSKNLGKRLVKHIESKGLEAKFHSADLASAKRKVMEKEFKEGSLRLLVATSTLAAGVNLPARRVIIAGVIRGNQLVEKSEIFQMIGRSGRKGIDDQGDAYVFFPDNKITLANEYKKVDNVVSKLFVVNDDLEYYKLAGHILALIHLEKKLSFDKIWNVLSNTYGACLGKIKSEYLKNTIDCLLRMRFIELIDDSYKIKRLGIPSVSFFIDPYDLSIWIKNFSRYFAGSVRKDSLLTYYLSLVPSNTKSFVTEEEKLFCGQYSDRIRELIGNSFVESSAIKFGYLYYCMLNNRSTGILSPLIPAVVKDFGRICACLNMVAKICQWKCGSEFFIDLKQRFHRKKV